jgi:hypothetical protein
VADLPVRSPSEGPLVLSVRAELAAAGRVDSWQGAAALDLARTIESDGTQPNAKAALVKQLHATVAEAVKGAVVAGNPVDELRARRVRRTG